MQFFRHGVEQQQKCVFDTFFENSFGPKLRV